jgi:hypothetical protein
MQWRIVKHLASCIGLADHSTTTQRLERKTRCASATETKHTEQQASRIWITMTPAAEHNQPKVAPLKQGASSHKELHNAPDAELERQVQPRNSTVRWQHEFWAQHRNQNIKSAETAGRVLTTAFSMRHWRDLDPAAPHEVQHATRTSVPATSTACTTPAAGKPEHNDTPRHHIT